jgi:hypothetical protein
MGAAEAEAAAAAPAATQVLHSGFPRSRDRSKRAGTPSRGGSPPDIRRRSTSRHSSPAASGGGPAWLRSALGRRQR